MLCVPCGKAGQAVLTVLQPGNYQHLFERLTQVTLIFRALLNSLKIPTHIPLAEVFLSMLYTLLQKV